MVPRERLKAAQPAAPAVIAVDVARASLVDKPTIAALLEAYCAEFGFHEEYPYFHAYWSDPLRYPFLLMRAGECAGFALVRSLGPGAGFEMAELYVRPECRGSGVGRSAVAALFCAFPARWRIPVQVTNEPGLAFWTRVLSSAPDSRDGSSVVFVRL